MKMLKTLIIIAAFFIVIGHFLPSVSETRVSIWTFASKKEVYKLVANWRKWPQWSPMLDAPPEYSYEGAKEGVGAQQISVIDSSPMGRAYWNIIKADPDVGITYYCVYVNNNRIRPALTGKMIFETHEDKTKVTWIESTEINYIIFKWIYFFTGPLLQNDLMSDGLTALKDILEKDL